MEIGSKEWHERRARSGGSSELPIVLGCSPFAASDPLTLAWQKRGLIDAVVDGDDEQRLIWDELEAMGRKWLAHALGCVVDKVPERDDFVTRCTSCGDLCDALDDYVTGCCCEPCEQEQAVHVHSNLDGRVMYEDRTLDYEGKSISWNNPDYDQWKRARVPKSVAWQVQQALYCSGLPAALIVVYDAPSMSFSTRVVEADEKKQAFLADAWRTWWTHAVFEGRDPAHDWTDSVSNAIKARWPDVTDDELMLDETQSADVEAWIEAKDHAGTYQKLASQGRAKVLKYMKNAHRITLTSGDYVIRSKSTNGRISLRHYKGFGNE